MVRAFALGLVGMLFAAHAAAGPTPWRLQYLVGAAAQGCPTREALVRSVRERLGRDPWDAGADREIRVRIERLGARLRAVVAVREANGAVIGARSLTSPRGGCRELGEAVALAITIAIDPLRFDPLRSASSRPAARRADRPPPARPTTRPRASSGVRLSVGLGGAVALGVAPGPAAGLSVQLAASWRYLVLAIEARVVLPTFEDVAGGGRISTWSAGGAALPCGVYRGFVACAVLACAALVAEGHDLVDARQVAEPYAAAGLRLGARLLAAGRFSLWLRGELAAALVRVALEDSRGHAYWTTPPVGGDLGLDLHALFW